MLLPRVSRVVLTVLIAAASLVTPEPACADHGTSSRETPADLTTHHGQEHQHDAPGPAGGGVPDQHRCCPALSSCSMSFDSAPLVIDGRANDPAGAPPARSATRLLSRSTPPEPPPPRA